MVRQVGMFDVEDRLAGLSRKGDGLERLPPWSTSSCSGLSSSAPCHGPTGRGAVGRHSITS